MEWTRHLPSLLLQPYSRTKVLQIHGIEETLLTEDLKLFEKISSFGYALGTDFIVGHTRSRVKISRREAIDRVKRLPITHITRLYLLNKR